MAEYIDKAEILAELDDAIMSGVALTDCDPRVFEIIRIFKRMVNDFPAAGVQPVAETEDLATATEQFICKNCGIRIENFDKVVLEEDNDGYINKLFYEYRFKYCSECGAKVK